MEKSLGHPLAPRWSDKSRQSPDRPRFQVPAAGGQGGADLSLGA